MYLNVLIRKLSKRFLPHSLRHYRNIVFRRVGEEELSAFFQGLGVKKGMTLYVQSSFSSLGYYPGGAGGLIKLLLELVGPEGTIVMPTFPFSGSMAGYVAPGPVFDVRQTPSAVGYLTEVFRTFPGTKRSLHPTHPVAALGRRAVEITTGHEKTVTPQGEDSPFARLAEDDGYVLRIGTAYYPLFHHLQEKLDYPNQFLPDPVTLKCLDCQHKRIEVTTRVHRPSLVPYIFCAGEEDEGEPVLINFSDFPILYSGRREDKLKADPGRRAAYHKLLGFRQTFSRRYGLAAGQINGCVCELFSIIDSLDFALAEAKKLLDQYKDFYNLHTLEEMAAKGGFPW
jgi:aminoglycoside N3'-acetyltransferase